MSLLIEKKEKIHGVEHTVITDKNGGFKAYYIAGKHNNRILHRQDGKIAFTTLQGKEEYHILGSQVQENQAREFGDESRKKYLKENIAEF